MTEQLLKQIEKIWEELPLDVGLYMDVGSTNFKEDRNQFIGQLYDLILSEKKESYDEGFSNGVEIGRVTKKPQIVTKYRLPKLRYKLSQLTEEERE